MNNDRQYHHARIRAWERYKIDLSIADCDYLTQQFQTGKTVRLAERHDGAAIHLVKIRHDLLRAVFMEGTGSLLTVLPFSSRSSRPKGIAQRAGRKVHGRTRKERDTDLSHLSDAEHEAEG